MIFLPQKMLEEKSKIHIVVMQVGNESLPYSGTKRKKKSGLSQIWEVELLVLGD